MSEKHELYKDFLEYALEQGVDLERVQVMYGIHGLYQGMHYGAEQTVHMFEELMHDFLDVQSVDDDPRLYALMEAPGSYEINRPFNFRDKD